jgi:hypothetical protein
MPVYRSAENAAPMPSSLVDKKGPLRVSHSDPYDLPK